MKNKRKKCKKKARARTIYITRMRTRMRVIVFSSGKRNTFRFIKMRKIPKNFKKSLKILKKMLDNIIYKCYYI